MPLVAALALAVVLRAGPDASTPARPSAESEVNDQLAAAAQKLPPGEVLVVVEGPDPKRYRLEEAVIRLDGVPVRTVSAAAAGAPGGPPAGTPVSDGDHVLSARLVYRGPALGPRPWEEGPQWAFPARVTVQASRGLRLVIRLTVEANDRAPVSSQRLALRSTVEPEMLVAVDDAPLPPPPLPNLPPPPSAEPPQPASTALPSKPAAKPPAKKKTKPAGKATRAAPAAANATAAAGPDTAEGLEQATARLRAALSAPRDAGPAPAGEAPR